MESTIISLIVDKNTNEYNCSFIGDGFLIVDNEVYENDMQNSVYYLPYFFNSWLSFIENGIISKTGFFKTQIIISTDGISTYADIATKNKKTIKEMVDYFSNNKFKGHSNKLTRQNNILKNGRYSDWNNDKIQHHDDISMILIQN
jgi:hypothetical protein